MNKRALISKFGNWLINNSSIKIMHTPDFAKYEIDRLLRNEASGIAAFEDENIFVGVYEYEFVVDKENSSDHKPHKFSFNAVGIGSKENVTKNDYELADYSEHTFIIK